MEPLAVEVDHQHQALHRPMLQPGMDLQPGLAELEGRSKAQLESLLKREGPSAADPAKVAEPKLHSPLRHLEAEALEAPLLSLVVGRLQAPCSSFLRPRCQQMLHTPLKPKA